MPYPERKMSPGLVVAVIAVAYACAFGLVIEHGMHMIQQETTTHQSS